MSAIHLLLETYPDADEYAALSHEWRAHVAPAMEDWIERFEMKWRQAAQSLPEDPAMEAWVKRFEGGRYSMTRAMNDLRKLILAAHAMGIDEGQRKSALEAAPIRAPVQRSSRIVIAHPAAAFGGD